MSVLLELLDIADAISDLPMELFPSQTCDGCGSYINGACSLWAGDCINSPDKLYWRPKVVAQQLSPIQEEA